MDFIFAISHGKGLSGLGKQSVWRHIQTGQAHIITDE